MLGVNVCVCVCVCNMTSLSTGAPVLQAEWHRLIFCKRPGVTLATAPWDQLYLDGSINVYFDDATAMSKHEKLRATYCLICEAKGHTVRFESRAQLSRHLETMHQRFVWYAACANVVDLLPCLGYI